ncbi:hypothetical protein MKW98_014622 [Papaver atlanticum]|uniref:Uncharacterized protein n=1 Tax=Papaver atlanticum TaxID=357466 RepID=A0AAD4XCS8_9MAGN|nr:hypothetical protein MKW98_014622 [Papaver atlanticum]
MVDKHFCVKFANSPNGLDTSTMTTRCKTTMTIVRGDTHVRYCFRDLLCIAKDKDIIKEICTSGGGGKVVEGVKEVTVITPVATLSCSSVSLSRRNSTEAFVQNNLINTSIP